MFIIKLDERLRFFSYYYLLQKVTLKIYNYFLKNHPNWHTYVQITQVVRTHAWLILYYWFLKSLKTLIPKLFTRQAQNVNISFEYFLYFILFFITSFALKQRVAGINVIILTNLEDSVGADYIFTLKNYYNKI
jgi:hypothetical protein